MMESMALLTPQYCATRAVIDYTEQHYIPAAKAYKNRSENKGTVGKQIIEWRNNLGKKWGQVRFCDVKIKTENDKHKFDVQVYLNGLNPKDLKVEIYAEGINSDIPEKHQMTIDQNSIHKEGFYFFHTEVPTVRPISDYTARIIPDKPGVSIPLENNKILWQK
jgi:starch phosphorylase